MYQIVLVIQTLFNGLLIGTVYSLVALGLTLIWGTMQLVNFAHGDFLMIAMYFSYWFFILVGIDPLLSLPIVFGIFAVIGLLFYQVIIKRIINKGSLSQVLATFGLGVVFKALALFFWSPNYRLIRGNILNGTFSILSYTFSIPEVVVAILCIIFMILLFIFLDYTKIGRAIKATTLNKEAALLVGVNIENVYTIVVALGIGLVGISGSLLSNFYYIFPEVGAIFANLAYVVVALGGFGSVKGALIGGLLIGVITSFAGFLIAPAFKYAAAFGLYIIIMALKPTGLQGW